MKNLLLVFFLFVNFCFANEQDLKYHRARIWFDGKSTAELASRGVDLSEGTFLRDKFFISDFSENEIDKIKSGGFRVDIIIEDVKTFYKNRNNSTNTTRQRSSVCGTFPPQYSIPSNFHLGSMGGFFTYGEMNQIIDSMFLLYPNLITAKQPIDTTLTIEGLPIYFLKISDNPNIDENEPEVLYDAVHHAREPQSMSELLFYMWYLLENYNSDTTIKALVDNTEMYFVPCVNPDGYIYNENNDPNGGGMWRKNRRDNLDGSFGVDLNRNYGYQWGFDTIGSSQYTNDNTYRGTSPFSEPETQAMRNFIISHEFRLAFNCHSYGSHNIYPWGFVPDSLTPDSLQYEWIGGAVTRHNNYNYGTTNQTLYYLVNGVADDWFYGEQLTKGKIFSMTPEVGNDIDGFWPASNRIVDLSLENVYANLTLARLAGQYGTLSHEEDRYVTQTTDYFKFNFRQLGLDTTGTFIISLLPLSSNISSVGAQVTISGLSSFQEVVDSISFTLIPTIALAEEISYVVIVNNGLYIEADTISQLYGSPVLVFNDDGSSISNWNNSFTSWGTTPEDYVSSPSSITDSPFNFYFPFLFESLTLINPVSLAGAIDARLNFFTKWNIENDFDYVQVLASSDNGNNWTPLCGKYTVNGTSSQASGEPLYCGSRFDWVKEEMSLNNYLGQDILLRFQIISDNALEYDGFYFDDLMVEIIHSGVGIDEVSPEKIFISSPVPNPSSSSTKINYSNVKNGSLIVYNSFGQLIREEPLTKNSGNFDLDVNKMTNGLYSCFIRQSDGKCSKVMKFIVSR